MDSRTSRRFPMESTSSTIKDDKQKKMVEMPNGLQNGKQGTPVRVFSRKRTRDATPEGLVKKAKRSESSASQEERINGLLGRTADIVLVLAGLAQMRGGKPATDLEKHLAADAQNNLASLVSKVAPSSLFSKSSLENVIGSMGLRRSADGSLEAAPRLQEAVKAGDDSDSDDESSESISAKDDGSQIQSSGLLTSPSALSWDDEADADLKHGEDYEEFEDEESAVMRHKQLAKLVQQLKAETFVPQAPGEVSNAYMITVVPCELCQILVKDATSVVVCDGCEKVYHFKCLQQIHLREFPKGDWSCPRCNGVKPKYGPVNKSSGTPNKMPVRKPENKQQPTLGGAFNLPNELLKTNSGNMSSNSIASNKLAMAAANTLTRPESVLEKSGIESMVKTPQQQQAKAVEASEIATAAGVPVTLHVDWVGEPQKVVNRKAYYSSCTVGGWTYKLHDSALFRPETPESPPYIARLQALWEDLDTGSKWVRVNWLYYPSDMPTVINRPEDVEADEIFETNHSDNNLVGSIQGPCQVLGSRKYQEEKERRRKLVTGGDLPPVFLCNWIYDVQKGEFQKVA